MSKGDRARYHHGDLRATLLDKAVALLDAEGVDAVTIRAVAREAGVTHAAPVNHFPSRNALLTAMTTGFFRQLAEMIETRLAAVGVDPGVRARAFALALVGFGLQHPHRYRLMWRRDLLLEDADLKVAMDGIYDRLITELDAARDHRRVSSDSVAIALWSLSHGYVAMRIDEVFEDRQDERTGQPRFEAMLDLLLAGDR